MARVQSTACMAEVMHTQMDFIGKWKSPSSEKSDWPLSAQENYWPDVSNV